MAHLPEQNLQATAVYEHLSGPVGVIIGQPIQLLDAQKQGKRVVAAIVKKDLNGISLVSFRQATARNDNIAGGLHLGDVLTPRIRHHQPEHPGIHAEAVVSVGRIFAPEIIRPYYFRPVVCDR